MFDIDCDYFRRKLKRILRDITSYRSDEFARECLRMAITANSDVFKEPEFQQYLLATEGDKDE